MQRIRLYIIELILMGILFLSVGFFGYLGYGLLLPDDNPNFSGEEALAHVNTQLKYGPRITGSERSQSMSTWLVEELSQEGWDVVIQPFVVPLSGDAAALSIEGNFSDESANSTEGEEPDTPEMAEAAEAVARNIIAIATGMTFCPMRPAKLFLGQILPPRGLRYFWNWPVACM